MKLLGGIIEISTISEGQYPGDTAGDSMIATVGGSADKPETAQIYSQPGFVSKAHKGQKGVRLRLGSIDIIIAAINYKVPNPADYGETKIYSTDEDGAEVAKIVIFPSGKIGIKNVSGSEDLKTVLSDLITEIQNIVTTGPPNSHTVDAASKAALTAINLRLGNIMEAL
jgi:hypothetical protein